MKSFLSSNFPYVVNYLVNWRKVAPRKVFQFCSFQKLTQTQLFCTKIQFSCECSGSIFFMYWIGRINTILINILDNFFINIPKKKSSHAKQETITTKFFCTKIQFFCERSGSIFLNVLLYRRNTFWIIILQCTEEKKFTSKNC